LGLGGELLDEVATTAWLPPAAAHRARKIELRSHRHHQHYDQRRLDLPERHETPDPPRSSALKPRFHGVRHRADIKINFSNGPGGNEI